MTELGRGEKTCGKKHGHKADTNPNLPWGALSSQCLTGTWFLILCFSSHSHQLKIENWAQASISRVVLDWYAEEAYWLDTRPDWGMQCNAKLCSPPLSSPTMFGLVWRRNPGESQVRNPSKVPTKHQFCKKMSMARKSRVAPGQIPKSQRAVEMVLVSVIQPRVPSCLSLLLTFWLGQIWTLIFSSEKENNDYFGKG